MKTSAPVFWSIHHMSRVSAAFITIITHLPEISLQPEVISILFFQIAWFGPNILQPNNILKKYLKSSHLDAPLTSKLHQEALIFPRCYATSATRINKLHNSVIRSDDAGPALTVQTHSAVHTPPPQHRSAPSWRSDVTPASANEEGEATATQRSRDTW